MRGLNGAGGGNDQVVADGKSLFESRCGRSRNSQRYNMEQERRGVQAGKGIFNFRFLIFDLMAARSGGKDRGRARTATRPGNRDAGPTVLLFGSEVNA
jgi:hypothetical protein